jgi:hypothetical protein
MAPATTMLESIGEMAMLGSQGPVAKGPAELSMRILGKLTKISGLLTGTAGV